MADDVRLATNCKYPLETFGRSGGCSPSVREVENACKKALNSVS
jgi:2-oxoglutarate ferredoxin oxidoreductase subunit alpha